MVDKHTVLVVDDEADVRETICDFVTELGHEYVSADSCAAAVERIEDRSVSCAIIDLNLGDENGLTLVSKIGKLAPSCVCIILTGDLLPATIVEAIREGASDYLMKPVSYHTFEAAVTRALEHSEVVEDRDRLLRELVEERELLEVRVTEANRKLQEHADRIECANARKEILLQLKSLATESYTEEDLFRCLFDELASELPLKAVVLTTACAHEYCIVAMRDDDASVRIVVVEASSGGVSLQGSPTQVEQLDVEVRIAAETHGGLAIEDWTVWLYPQRSLGQVLCGVAFFLPKDFEVDDECGMFMGTCAGAVTGAWMDLRFLEYTARQARVGNLALDLSRGMVQELTAIRTTTDVLKESAVGEEAAVGLAIIEENVDRLGRRLLDLREISSPHKDSAQTVNVGELIDRALGLLDNTIEQRGIVLERDFQSNDSCILFNGSALASTFLDLISSAVRAVPQGGCVRLSVNTGGSETVVFDLGYDSEGSGASGHAWRATYQSMASTLQNHPKFIMAQRTVRRCGGALSVEVSNGDRCLFRIILPKNALTSNTALERMGVV